MSTGTEAQKITRRHTFVCIDGHTCGNPVRLVTTGHPYLKGNTMSKRRLDFIKRYDWVRTALMYEPRGHDVMSGGFLYPATRPDCDLGVIFIEVSYFLPMCGHATIGIVTMGIERGLFKPKTPGLVRLDTPAGLVEAHYQESGGKVETVKIYNVPSFLALEGVKIDCPGLGELSVDISYGGNFYAIVEPQKNFPGVDHFTASDIQRYSPLVRSLVDEAVDVFHPNDPSISGIKHVMWVGKPKNKAADGMNAVFYGSKGIDRSPCGTGTSARMAQLAARGQLKEGKPFIHESIIGSLFEGRVEGTTKVGKFSAIKPSISGWAKITGDNIIFVDPDDPFWRGFQVK